MATYGFFKLQSQVSNFLTRFFIYSPLLNDRNRASCTLAHVGVDLSFVSGSPLIHFDLGQDMSSQFHIYFCVALFKKMFSLFV